MSLVDLVSKRHETESNPTLRQNTLLYAIGKSFLEAYPQYNDVMTTYEHALDTLPLILGNKSSSIINLPEAEGTSVKVHVWMDNVRMFKPNSTEAFEFTGESLNQTPSTIIATRGTYSMVLVADVHMSFKYRTSKRRLAGVKPESKTGDEGFTHLNVPNGYIVKIPIPLGCKYCVLRDYDELTLIRSGNDFRSLYGMFIIEGFIRYILPVYKKPFNSPIVIFNRHEDQLSRSEAIHTVGFDYDLSFYSIGAYLEQRSKTIAKGSIPPARDFGFSLQFNHPAMNQTTRSRKGVALINFIPIKFLFTAFGCTNDHEMLTFICPTEDDFNLMSAVSEACLRGYKHREAIAAAELELEPNTTFILYKEAVTEQVAKYVIGTIILTNEYKAKLLAKCTLPDKRIEYKAAIVRKVNKIFDKRFMPGIGSGTEVDRNLAICTELGAIVRKLYMVGNRVEPEQEKAALPNRRIRSGQQFTHEFKRFHSVRIHKDIMFEMRSLFPKHASLTDSLVTEVHRTLTTLCIAISAKQTRSIINAFKGTSKEQSRIRTDVINPRNQAFIWNKLREIVISSELGQKGATVTWIHRAVHQSTLFFICPIQTPESGAQTGKYITPGIYTYVTLDSDTKGAIKIIQEFPNYVNSIATALRTSRMKEMYTLRVNGSIVGYISQFDDIDKLYKKLMDERRTGTHINHDASVSLNHRLGRLDIWTDIGRLVTPFVVVENCFNITANADGFPTKYTPKPTFIQWLTECATKIHMLEVGINKGFIEYFDSDMAINNAVIAESIKAFVAKPYIYSHIAIPNQGFGIIGSLIPGVNLNPAVRSAYATNHVKSCIALSTPYPQMCYFGAQHISVSNQLPIARTVTFSQLRMENAPLGQNVMIAFLMYEYNQEDAIIINASSVQSGLFRMESYTTRYHKILRNEDKFSLPGDEVSRIGEISGYAKLDPKTCLPRNVGEIFYTGDPLIGMTRTVLNSHRGVADISVLNDEPDGRFPAGDEQRPHRSVLRNRIHGDNTVMKMVVTGQYRGVIAGDKFNSEQAQKGTCGKVMDPARIPYTTTGLRPDIVFNAPAILKRKTYGHLYIAMLQKIAALYGCPIDCTPNHTIRTTSDVIALAKKLGMNDGGYEVMYDPETGQPFKALIFFAPHYYQRQSHLVENKLSIRWGGPRIPETGQPTKGRRRGGGSVVERMSLDCLTAAGISELVRDARLVQGSRIRVGFCTLCGNVLCYHDKSLNRWTCPTCGIHPLITIRLIPPAANLVNHILQGLHIGVRYIPSEQISMHRRFRTLAPPPEITTVEIDEVVTEETAPVTETDV